MPWPKTYHVIMENKPNKSPSRSNNNKNGKRKFYRRKNKGPKKTDNKNSNNRNNNNHKKKTGPKLTGIGKALQKYDNLLEQYITIRKKYFAVHGRPSKKQKTKTFNNYMRTLKDLRNFEVAQTGKYKEALDKKLDLYPLDDQYSKSHPDEKALEVSFSGDFLDQHYLETQQAAKYAGDTEESEGTMEDYEKYKESVS